MRDHTVGRVGLAVNQRDAGPVVADSGGEPADRRINKPVTGIILMLLGSSVITFNDAATKVVVTDHAVSQALFVRSIFSLAAIAFLVHREGGWHAARWNSLSAQLICGVPLVTSVFLFIWSLSFIPIAIATIIFYLSPLFVTALAPLLGERVGWRRWAAVVVGFAGAVLVIEPTGGGFTWMYIVPVAAALTLALRDLAARKIVAGESSLSILVFSTLALMVATLPPAIAQWTAFSLTDYALLAFSGLCFGISLFLLTEAFRYADASLVSPVKYSGVVVAAGLGYVVWGDVPSLSALAGAVLIIASVLMIMRREQAKALPSDEAD